MAPFGVPHPPKKRNRKHTGRKRTRGGGNTCVRVREGGYGVQISVPCACGTHWLTRAMFSAILLLAVLPLDGSRASSHSFQKEETAQAVSGQRHRPVHKATIPEVRVRRRARARARRTWRPRPRAWPRGTPAATSGAAGRSQSCFRKRTRHWAAAGCPCRCPSPTCRRRSGGNNSLGNSQ